MTKIDAIADIICDYYKIDKEKIFKKNRSGNIIKAKCLICYYARSILDLSYMQIAHYFRHHEHTTILHRCRVVAGCLNTKDYIYDDYCNTYDSVSNILVEKKRIMITITEDSVIDEIMKFISGYDVEVEVINGVPPKNVEVVDKKIVRMETLSPADEVRRKYL